MTKSVFSQEYEMLRRLLVEARLQEGLTQGDVASVLGRPQSFVSKYERGERRLDVVEFLQVAEVLKISAASLVMELELEFFPEGGREDILRAWEITSRDLTWLLNASPSLRGMLFGYVGEFKLVLTA